MTSNNPVGQTMEAATWQPLGPFTIAQLFVQFLRERKSGLLTLSRKEEKLSILFHGGLPVFANSNLPADSLGSFLQKQNLLTKAECDQLVEAAKKQSKQLAMVMVESKRFSPEDTSRIVKEHYRALVQKAFAWTGGHHHFETQPMPEKPAPGMVAEPLELVIAGIRQGFTLDRYASVGIVAAGFFARVDKPLSHDLQKIAWSPIDLRVREALNGRKSLADTAAALGLSLDEIAKIVCVDLVLGLVRQAPAPGVTASKPSPAATLAGEPQILGDVDELERVYFERKTLPSDEVMIGDSPEEEPQQKALQEAPVAQAKPQSSPNPAAGGGKVEAKSAEPFDEAEDTLDDLPGSQSKAAEQKPPSKSELSKSKPVPVGKSAEPPSTKPADPTLKIGSSAMPTRSFLSLAIASGSAFMVMAIGALLFIYSNPEKASEIINRIRLYKMYGKVTLDPRRLGQYFEDDGQLKKAKDHFHQALAADPNEDRLLLTLARIHERLEEWPEARKFYEEALKRNPALTEAHLGLGWCYLHDGEVIRAQREFYLYLSASSISPKTETIRKLVAGFKEDAGNP